MSLLVAVLAIVVGMWWLGSRVESPEQRAARDDAFGDVLVLAPIEERVLTDTVIARGQVMADNVVVIDASSTVGSRVVTNSGHPAGATLSEGAVLIELDSRPVILFMGALPPFRDLRPGVEGADVIQVQLALGRLGLYSGKTSGRFDQATQRAVEALYEERGYTAQQTGPDSIAALQSARDALQIAERGAFAATLRLQDSMIASDTALLRTRRALVDSEARLAAAQRARASRSTIQTAESAVAQSQLDLERALLRVEVVEATLASAAAELDVDAARRELQVAENTHGVILPAAELAVSRSGDAVVLAEGPPVGTIATGPVLEIGSASLIVLGRVDRAAADLLSIGGPVLIDHQESGDESTGTVREIIDDNTAIDEGIGPQSRVVVSPDEGLGLAWVGRNVRVRFVVDSTGAPGLVVPESALRLDDLGQPFVLVVNAQGSEPERVDITVERTLGGFATINVAGQRRLPAGGRVVVGSATGAD